MTDSKTATERLREMLDERGVAHYDSITATGWRGVYGEEVLAISIRKKSSEQIFIQHYPLTPEQAIAITLDSYSKLQLKTGDALSGGTLGSGECEMCESSEYVECKVQTFTCSACGWHGVIDDLLVSDTIPNFCPNCGAKAINQ